jgi:hypothetical protein
MMADAVSLDFFERCVGSSYGIAGENARVFGLDDCLEYRQLSESAGSSVWFACSLYTFSVNVLASLPLVSLTVPE